LTYLALGLSTGISAGLSPGPLLTMVITASLRSGFAGGLRVALSPLITDLPIILLSVLLSTSLPVGALRWVGTVGALVVIGLGVEALHASRNAQLPRDQAAQAAPQGELWRGALVNALNPNPYLFWMAVGGPALVSSWRISPWYTLAFIVSFYGLLIGSKIVVAWLVSRQAGSLSLTWYRRILAGCGLLLFAMAALLLWKVWHGA